MIKTISAIAGLATSAITYYLLRNTKTGEKVVKEAEKVADSIPIISSKNSVNNQIVEDNEKPKERRKKNMETPKPKEKASESDSNQSGRIDGSNPDLQQDEN